MPSTNDESSTPRCVPAGVAMPRPPRRGRPLTRDGRLYIYIFARRPALLPCPKPLELRRWQERRRARTAAGTRDEGPGGVPGRRRGGARRGVRRRRVVVVVVGRPGGEAPAAGGGVQGLRRGGQGQGVAPQRLPLDQGPLHRPRAPLLT